MAQDATTQVPPKGLWTLKIADFIKGAIISCSAQLLAILDFWFHSDHFPTYTEWQPYIKATIYFFILYIAKNFSTNNVGQLFAKDKPVVPVDVDHLNNLKQQAEINKTT